MCTPALLHLERQTTREVLQWRVGRIDHADSARTSAKSAPPDDPRHRSGKVHEPR